MTERKLRTVLATAARLSCEGWKGCREEGNVENCLTVRCPCGEEAARLHGGVSHMDIRDVRVDSVRDPSPHWRAKCRATHLPTGLFVDWEDAWNKRDGRNQALMVLEELVRANGQS